MSMFELAQVEPVVLKYCSRSLKCLANSWNLFRSFLVKVWLEVRGGAVYISTHSIASRRYKQHLSRQKKMKIFEALGFVILVLTLKFLTPEIYAGIKSTLLVFFDTAQGIMHGAKYSMTAGFIPNVPTLAQ